MTTHLYDFKRTANDGPRVLCGRRTEDVRWTAGYTDSGRKVKVTCKSCLRRKRG
jgi:hypothetical protein